MIFSSLLRSLKIHFRGVLRLLLLLGFFLGTLLVIAFKSGVEPSDLTRDYSGVYHLEPYVGLISYLGIFFWITALALSWFAWRILDGVEGKERESLFFWWSGLITLILAIDDLFQLHEIIVPEYLGWPERSFYFMYLILLSIYTIKFHRILLNQHVLIISLAYFFFAVSMTFDVLFEMIPFGTYFEDCFKFSGIVLWAYYFIRFVNTEIRGLMKKAS